MREALRLAEEAGTRGEVPVGAVLVSDGEVLGRGQNRMRERCDPRAHAEMEAIDAARSRRPGGRMDDAVLYVTLEPCPMCAGACLTVRIPRVVFGAWDPRLGAAGSRFDVFGAGVPEDVRVRPGVLGEECGALLSGWFRERRKRSGKHLAERCQSG